jgi:hypothetical protein
LFREVQGCELLYLPAYSPNFGPIEKAFAEIEGNLRKAGACCRDALIEAIGRAISAVGARMPAATTSCEYRATVRLFRSML